MAHTTSRLSAKLSTEAQNNDGIPWSAREAQTELMLNAMGVPSGSGALLTNYSSTVFTTGGVAGQIPAGVLSWSFTCLTGTSVVGGATVSPGQTVRGGAYGLLTSKTILNWTLSGTALIAWDLPS